MTNSAASRDCLSNDELIELLANTAANAPAEQHLTICNVCRDRLDVLAGDIPNPSSEPSTRVPDSAALTQAIAHLCSVRPDLDGTFFEFLKPSDNPSALGKLDKYEIESIIGQGGMGIVFGAFDPSLCREVAIKVPTPSFVATREAYDRFLREARAMASVRHDNIVTVHAVEEVDGIPFLVMERIHGKSLEQELRERQQLPFHEVLLMASETCAALAAAHESGLVHRDIKPANILLEDETNRVKVTDFGLAKSDADGSRTAHGIIVGTPEFMSPEQATESEVTASSDLFSLGVVLYTTLAGPSPFRGNNALATMQRVCTEIPPSVRTQNSDVPIWFDQLLSQMMAKDIRERPQSAIEVSNAIQQQTAPRSRKGSFASPARFDHVRAAWTKVVVAVVAVALIGMTAAFWPWESDGPTNDNTVTSASKSKPGFYLGDKSFGSLGEAILAAANGDTIHVAENGPYRVPGFQIDGKRLTIQAQAGARPVFETSDSHAVAIPFVRTSSDLTLRGLEIRWQLTSNAMGAGDTPDASSHCAVTVAGGKLTISRCRIVCGAMTGCAGATSDSVNIEDSRLTADGGPCVVWNHTDHAGFQLRNCVLKGSIGLFCVTTYGASKPEIAITNNTFQTARGIQLVRPRAKFKIDVTRNAFDVVDVLVVVASRQKTLQTVETSHVIGQLKTFVEWSGNTNAFGRSANFYSRSRPGINQRTRPEVSSLADWQSIWGTESKSFEADFEPVEADAGSRRQQIRVLNNSRETVDDVGARTVSF